MSFQDQVRDLGACKDAVRWIGERDIQTAYKECERADWMLWLFGRMVGTEGWPTRQEVVLAACDCAETVKHLWAEGNACSEALRVTRAWANGDATLAEVRAAAHAAYAAYAAYAAMCDLIRKRLNPGALL